MDHMQTPQPKGRGRPRASFGQTGEFDLGLIREYHLRPALYDRSSKFFKDKPYVAQQWQNISHKLGYDVSLLRDRMLQLRNRYNIEKRRLDMMRAENPTAPMVSQWPLYENLNFLSDHIRTRRSFKSMTKTEGHEEEESYEMEDGQSESDGHLPDIKVELSSDDPIGQGMDDDDEVYHPSSLPVTAVLNIPRQTERFLQNNSQAYINGINGSASHSRRRCVEPIDLNSLIVAAPKLKRPAEEDQDPSPKRQYLNATGPVTSHKFVAFGEFLAHSLADLPQPVALRLVEKFTTELVQTALRVNLGSSDIDHDEHDEN